MLQRKLHQMQWTEISFDIKLLKLAVEHCRDGTIAMESNHNVFFNCSILDILP